jgi:hypothetical protein
MRISKITIATLFVFAMAFASFGFAQDRPATGDASAEEMIVVMDMQAKPGMGLEWENYLKKDLLPAMKKAGMKNINAAMTDQFGVGDLYSFWWPITSLAEFDGPSPFQKALGPDGLVVLLANIQRCIASTHTYMLSSRPNLQIASKPGYEIKLAVIVSETVAPGRTVEYEKNAKEMIAVLAKANAKAVYVSRVGLGGNPNEYRVLIGLDNYADIQQFGLAFSKALSEAKLAPQTGIIMHSEMQVYKTRADLGVQ